MEFISFIGLVAVLVLYFRLRDRINHLENIIRGGVTTPVVSQTVVSSTPPSPSSTADERLEMIRRQLAQGGQPQVSQSEGKFIAWLKEDWLMKLGALLFIIGCGWFVSYAFANNWIGPMGRITLGVLVGVIIMALGYWRMIRFPSQGSVFTALGAGVAMLTVFAAREVYGFFTPSVAVIFDFAVAAFVCYASYQFNIRSLAYIGQVLAYVAPLLAAGESNTLMLFTYLLATSCAMLFLAANTGWRGLILTSLVFVSLYSMPFVPSPEGMDLASSYAKDSGLVLNFIYLFSMLFFFSGMVAVIKSNVSRPKMEIVLAVFNGFLLFVWISSAPLEEWRSLIFSAWAVVFALGSFLAFRFSNKLAPFYAYGSIAVAYIVSATAIELEGAVLNIALIVEVFLIVMSIYSLTKNTKGAALSSILFIFPAFLSIASIDEYARSENLFTKDLLVLVLMSAALVVAGRVLSSAAKKDSNVVGKIYDGSTLVVFGTIFIWIIVWLFVHNLLPNTPDMATMITLVIYTIAGLLAYFAGLFGHDKARRVYGAGLLAFVVARPFHCLD
jgi:hypothetical protein